METLTKRFRLTEGSFFMKQSQIDTFGLTADTPAAQALLRGEGDPIEDLTEVESGMLHAFEQAHSIRSTPPINTDITKEDFQKYWRGVKERTSSSISTLHFGHYKAAALDQDLSEAHSILLHIATRRGISLQRWRRGLTIMLEKIPGCTLVEKLRAILLMEADYNMLNKLLIGSRMMQHAEELK